MGNSKQELTNHPKASSKTGRKSRGTTSNKTKSPRGPASTAADPGDESLPMGSKAGAPSDGRLSPGSKAGLEPGEGATLLRDAVNQMVGKECRKIAQTLVDKTIEGNMTGARLIAELSGANHPRNQPPRKRHAPILPWSASQLASEPPWQAARDEAAAETGCGGAEAEV